ncbi:MAG: DNA polymerase IV [Polyangia bacterium]|jgi:DNA polymerase-4|nr:DNA polymerase IV [Polyangia bacterium]
MTSAWSRIILHADMDAFFASVEELDDPALGGKPVIVGGTGRRGVVAAASYAARRFGVRSAMPTAEARRRCPQGIFLPPRFDRYQALSEVVMSVFDHFSPKVEPLSIDEAFLDMTGAERLFGPPEEMGRRLKAEVKETTMGLTVSVGLAATKYVAKVASDHDKPDGLTVVPPGETLDFLWPLGVRQLWGVGPGAAERLESLGLRTIGDVAKAPAELLRSHFGAQGEHLLELANGRDDREVEPGREAKSVGAEFTLERDVLGAAAIRRHLRRAADRVAPRLRAEGTLASGLRVKLKTAWFQLLTRQAPLDPPSDAAKDLFEAACELLSEFDLRIPYRLVGLAAYGLLPAGAPRQGELFDDGARERQGRLERTLDTLRDRFGQELVRRASDLDEPEEPEKPR